MLLGALAEDFTAREPKTIFDQVASAGFTAVQFDLLCAGTQSLPQSLPLGLPEAVRLAAAEARITLSAVTGAYNMIHPDQEIRASQRNGFKNVLRAARDMGVPVVTLCTGTRDREDMWRQHPDNGQPDAWRDLIDELGIAVAAAADAGLRIGIEPEPGNVIWSAPLARRALDEIGGHSLGVVLDAANLLSPQTLSRQHEIFAEAARLLGKDLILAHAKDISPDGSVVAPGEGAVDLAAFLRAIKGTGYDGALIAHSFREDQARDVHARLVALAIST